jgi:hypothetical protein
LHRLPNLLLISALLCLLQACQGGTPKPGDQAGPTPPPAPTNPEGPVVLRAASHAFTAAQLDQHAKVRGLSSTKAAQELATLALVVQEGGALGLPCAPTEALPACSQRILETLFPTQRDCPGVSDAELDQFYELSYSPDWLFDYLEGASLSRGLADLTTGPSALAELRRLAALWNYRKDLTPALARLAPQGYRELPFKVMLRPHLAPGDQGWQSGLPPQALTSLAAMTPGQIGQPLLVDDLALVLRLDLRRPPRLKTDPAFRALLRQDLCLRRAAEARDKWTSDLRKTGFVEINLPPQDKRN